MKTKRYTTTEFYKRPSEAISFVKDGGTVQLVYKRLKDPIAVITPYKKSEEKKKEFPRRSKKFFSISELKDLIVSEPRFSESDEHFFRERRKR